VKGDRRPLHDLRAPFPWFGGKSRAAGLIWDALGDVPNYVEPFAGSLAVLLARPHVATIETVNDLDCYLANFWRALKLAPDEVAEYANWPVNEADLSARHQWLVDRAGFRERMRVDPDHYDAKIAGWWVWGLCSWIGGGWCDAKKYRDEIGDGKEVYRQLPALSSNALSSKRGVNRQLPHLGDAGREVKRQLPHLDRGRGINRQLPHLGDAGREVNRLGDAEQGIVDYMRELSARLRRTRVACGSWERVLGATIGPHLGLTGVLLDPPYVDGNLTYAVGGAGISADVRAWAVEHDNNPRLRIALCGYEGEHDMPAAWRCQPWKTKGGYAARGSQAGVNQHRERIWFSPHCIGVRQSDLFDGGA